MNEADPERSRHSTVDGARSKGPGPKGPEAKGPEAKGPGPKGPEAKGPEAKGMGGTNPDDVPFAPDVDWVREQRSSLQYAAVGIQFGLTISLFALLGRWLDGRFGTSPWLLLLGVLLGFGGGTYSLLKKVSSSAG